MLRSLEIPAPFSGSILRPGDPEFATATRLWNIRRAEQVPALIAQVADVSDVVSAVAWAAEQDLQVAVRSGGHGVDGSAMAHDALVIDTSRMKAISVDPDARQVTIEAGVLLRELDAATQEHGLVVPSGTVGETGAAGLTLGGGIGHLSRRFGATVDHLVSIDVVTMEGRVLTVSADSEPELFWGMRGAGHNLAIATSFTYRAHPVGPEVMSGVLAYSEAGALQFMEGIDEAMKRAPRSLSIALSVLPGPPMPGLPAEFIGTPVLLAIVVYTGPRDEYGEAMAAVDELATPVAGGVGPSLWVEANDIVGQFNPSGRRYHTTGGFLPGLSAELAQVAIDAVRAAPQPTGPTTLCNIVFPMLGGALREVDEDATAFSRAGAEWLFEGIAMWDQPAEDEEYMSWVTHTLEAFLPYMATSGYVNLTADRGAEWLREVYGLSEKWERIVALKHEWDPANRLSHNKNVVRAIEAAAI